LTLLQSGLILTSEVKEYTMKDKTIKIRMSKEREAAITTVVTELSMDDVFAMAADAKEKRESEKG
jgi:hypothetical protein|tara:strand:- start:8697 stop:8891 length:195 start_codon:yes stop_codon:yes gene_type:complete